MYRYYMRKSDPEEPPKLEEPLDERDGRYKRLQKDKAKDDDTDEKVLEEQFYRYKTFKLLMLIRKFLPCQSNLQTVGVIEVIITIW